MNPISFGAPRYIETQQIAFRRPSSFIHLRHLHLHLPLPSAIGIRLANAFKTRFRSHLHRSESIPQFTTTRRTHPTLHLDVTQRPLAVFRIMQRRVCFTSFYVLLHAFVASPLFLIYPPISDQSRRTLAYMNEYATMVSPLLIFVYFRLSADMTCIKFTFQTDWRPWSTIVPPAVSPVRTGSSSRSGRIPGRFDFLTIRFGLRRQPFKTPFCLSATLQLLTRRHHSTDSLISPSSRRRFRTSFSNDIPQHPSS